MAKKKTSNGMERFKHVLSFFIGLFGALAILGVFFKIMKYPNYELFMVAGFIGEAAAFVIMGFFSLMEAFKKNPAGPEAKDTAAEGGSAVEFAHLSADHMNALLKEQMEAVSKEMTQSFRAMLQDVTSTFHKMLDERVAHDLGTITLEMAKEAKRFTGEMSSLTGEITEARGAMHMMRTELGDVATGTLASDASKLGQGMSLLAGEMQTASTTVENIRRDLTVMEARFRQFNSPVQPEAKMRKVS